MSNDGSGNPVSDVLPTLPWVSGPPDVSYDLGDNTPMIGAHDREADLRATDKYFGRERAESNPVPPKTPFEEAVRGVYSYCEAVCLKKHRDYGHKNISLAPGGPLNGLRVRMHDKLSRINNLIDSGATPENESLRDSFLDMANYSIIAMLVLDGDWPGCE